MNLYRKKLNISKILISVYLLVYFYILYINSIESGNMNMFYLLLPYIGQNKKPAKS